MTRPGLGGSSSQRRLASVPASKIAPSAALKFASSRCSFAARSRAPLLFKTRHRPQLPGSHVCYALGADSDDSGQEQESLGSGTDPDDDVDPVDELDAVLNLSGNDTAGSLIDDSVDDVVGAELPASVSGGDDLTAAESEGVPEGIDSIEREQVKGGPSQQEMADAFERVRLAAVAADAPPPAGAGAAVEEDEDEELDIDALLGEEGTDDGQAVNKILDRIGFTDLKPEKEVMPDSPTKADYPETAAYHMNFGDLLRAAHYNDEVLEQYRNVCHIEVWGIANDPAMVRPGWVYVCETSPSFNGHHFIPDAVTRGASIIVAKLMVPYAELGYMEDIDPTEPGKEHVLETPYFKGVLDEAEELDAVGENLEEAFAKLDEWAEKEGIDEKTLFEAKAGSAFRAATGALKYDASHWENPNKTSLKDSELTPHPYNVEVPLELTTPVIFAIDPIDMASALTAAFYKYPSRRIKTYGIAGTTGKTSVAWLLRIILEKHEQLIATINSLEYSIGLDLLDLRGNLWGPVEEDSTSQLECSSPYASTPYKGKYSVPCTTPDHIAIQELIASMADRQADACILEASAMGLHQGRLDEVHISVAILTCIGERNYGKDAYFDSEREMVTQQMRLFAGLSGDSVAVINLDDEYAEVFMCAAEDAPIVTYSFHKKAADIYVVESEDNKFGLWESSALIQTPMGLIRISTALLFKEQMYNILAALAAALVAEVPLQTIANAIQDAEMVPGRFETIDEGQQFQVIVDTAQTPESLETLFQGLRSFPETERIITVVGCPGEHQQSMRPLVAELVHARSDIVIFTNDSPGTEAPERIIEDIVEGLPEEVRKGYPAFPEPWLVDVGRARPIFEEETMRMQGEQHVHIIEDRFTAIRAAISIAQPNDVVVLAGKGARDYMDHADVNSCKFRGWFDDRVEARNAITKLKFLDQITNLDRTNLPWTRKFEE